MPACDPCPRLRNAGRNQPWRVGAWTQMPLGRAAVDRLKAVWGCPGGFLSLRTRAMTGSGAFSRLGGTGETMQQSVLLHPARRSGQLLSSQLAYRFIN